MATMHSCRSCPSHANLRAMIIRLLIQHNREGGVRSGYLIPCRIQNRGPGTGFGCVVHVHAQSRAKRRLATTNQSVRFGPDHRGSCIPKVILPCSIKAAATRKKFTLGRKGRRKGRRGDSNPPPQARTSEFEL